MVLNKVVVESTAFRIAIDCKSIDEMEVAKRTFYEVVRLLEHNQNEFIETAEIIKTFNAEVDKRIDITIRRMEERDREV